jgi:hypothetical protein
MAKLKYIGPKKYKPDWIGGKGVSKKQIAQYLVEHQNKYPQYWVEKQDDVKQPYPLKHKDHQLYIMNGKWGPHTKRVMCLTCNNAFVMWGKKK